MRARRGRTGPSPSPPDHDVHVGRCERVRVAGRQEHDAGAAGRSGSVAGRAVTNTTGVFRTGAFTIGGKKFKVSQEP